MGGLQIGIEIGGTFARAVAVNNTIDSNPLNYTVKKLPFRKSGYVQREIEQNICMIINDYLQRYNRKKLCRIGISLAASIDRKTGIINAWSNNPEWVGFNIKEFLTQKYDVPVLIEDDANCGALGEYFFGECEDLHNLIYVSIGTGIGCGVVINGEIYIGENGFAGELGHVLYGGSSGKCSCGQEGCFQASISGRGILNKYCEMTKRSEYRIGDIVKGAKLKIQPESDLIREVIHNLSICIYNVVMLYDISNIILGGGVSLELIEFIPEIENTVNKRLNIFNRFVHIKPSKCRENSGVLGALKLK